MTTRDDAFAAELPLLDQELQDRQLASVMEHLLAGGAAGEAGMKAALREIHERDPQELVRMRDRVQMAKLRRAEPTTAH